MTEPQAPGATTAMEHAARILIGKQRWLQVVVPQWLRAEIAGQPSDLYPDALGSPPSERRAFHRLATIAFNRAAVEAKEASNGDERRGIDQTDDP